MCTPVKTLATVEAALKAAFVAYQRAIHNAAADVLECDDTIRDVTRTIDAIGCPESTHMDYFNDLDDAKGRRDRYIDDMYHMRDQFLKTLSDIENLVEKYTEEVEDTDIPESEY